MLLSYLSNSARNLRFCAAILPLWVVAATADPLGYATDQSSNNVSVKNTAASTIASALPGAPTINSALSGNSRVTISFTPPASDGGATITRYTADCMRPTDGAHLLASGPASPLTVMKMSNGNTYSCYVKAANAHGAGAPSKWLK